MEINNMHVHIYINDVEYTDYIISYVREHKICTGIGTITLEIRPDIPHEIITWDNIIIEENGNTKEGSYYVTSVAKRQPSGEFMVIGQDASKRLTDHFIDTQWIIDYPSYSLYWIQYFLDDAGVSYEIHDPFSQLLSNSTQLGLCSNYDQIITLLQMNGWYMYFDPDDVCHIGSLDKDFSDESTTIHTDDILSIEIVSHDKMLRNRVLVTGAADTEAGSGILRAEVIRHTPWDYDFKDLRTVVISNSNIRTREDAVDIASTAIEEFAQITVEKHISVRNSLGLNIGDVIRVRDDYFNGKGLITTYGTSMSKDGLVTNLVLDERCPRLFAFFGPTDIVYAGTYGDGVYGKFIDLDPNWYFFSETLTDQRVTDLHINNGNFALVTAGGQFFYADNSPIVSYAGTMGSGYTFSGIEDRGVVLTSIDWKNLPLTNIIPTVTGLAIDTPYSGLMARATIVDRLTNKLKIAADTRPVPNLGDYMMSTSYENLPLILSGLVFDPLNPLASGVPSSGFQACIIEANAFGSLGSIYPIRLSAAQVSGYGITITEEIAASGMTKEIGIYDIETDSVTDYVTIGITTTGLIYPWSGNMGYRPELEQNFPKWAYRSDTDVNTLFYTRDMSEAGAIYAGDLAPSYPNNYYRGIAVFDNEANGQRDIFCTNTDSAYGTNYRLVRLNKSIGGISTTYKTSDTFYTAGHNSHLTNTTTRRITDDRYKIYGWLGDDATGDYVLYRDDVDFTAENSLVRTELYRIEYEQLEPPGGVGFATYDWVPHIIMTDGVYHGVIEIFYSTSVFLVTDPLRYYCRLQYFKYDTNIETLVNSPFTIFEDTTTDNDHIIIPLDRISEVYPVVMPYKDACQVYLMYVKAYYPPSAGDILVHDFTVNQFFYIPGLLSDTAVLWEPGTEVWKSETGWSEGASDGLQQYNVTPVSDERFVASSHFRWGTGIDKVVISNGFNWHVEDRVYKYFYEDFNWINPTMGPYIDGMYITHSGSRLTGTDYWLISSENFQIIDHILNPPAYKYISPFVNRDSSNNQLLWLTEKLSTSGTVDSYAIVETPMAAPSSISAEIPFTVVTTGVGNQWMMKVGNFINPAGSKYYYLDAGVYTPVSGTIYFVLQRDNEDYVILRSGLFPDRIDISNFSPLVTMERTVESMGIYDINLSGYATSAVNVGMTGIGVNGTQSGIMYGSGTLGYDYRYADYKFGDDGILPTEMFPQGYFGRAITVVYGSGLGMIDCSNPTSMSEIAATSSGNSVRIETTNKSLPDQYIFITVSGISNSQAVFSGATVQGEWGFKQKDPSGIFVDYSSGYPATRTTIIRIDDRI